MTAAATIVSFEDWEQWVEDKSNPVNAARVMQVPLSEARKQMQFAAERIAERERLAVKSRQKPSLSEALQIWGTKGIMRVKSRVRYERTIAIPQSMT